MIKYHNLEISNTGTILKSKLKEATKVTNKYFSYGKKKFGLV